MICLVISYLVLSSLGLKFSFPFLPDLSTIYFTLVNIICLFLLYQILKKEGRSIKELLGYQRSSLFRDILFGFLWLFILYIPFVLAVMGTMFLLFGMDFMNQFEVVFAGNVDQYYSRPAWLAWCAAIISLIFPFLNAPTEELIYRGYAQPLFLKHYGKVWLSILIPSIGFAIQHVMLAASVEGAIVYAASFFVWGIGSGIIYYKQKRLFPLIVCHFIVNIAFSVLPIIILILG